MRNPVSEAVDLIHDLSLLDLYADNGPMAISVDRWGNEWEDTNDTDTDYFIVND